MGGRPGESGVNSWWWVPIGLAAWFLVALAVGLVLGPILRRCAEAREALEHQWTKAQGTTSYRDEPAAR